MDDWETDGWVTRRLGKRCLDDMGGMTWAGRLGNSIGQQQKLCTSHSTTGMKDLSYKLRIRGHDLTLTHTKLIYLAKRGHSALNDVGINGGKPKKGSIVCVLTAIRHTCRGMTHLLSQLQLPQLRENLAY